MGKASVALIVPFAMGRFWAIRINVVDEVHVRIVPELDFFRSDASTTFHLG